MPLNVDNAFWGGFTAYTSITPKTLQKYKKHGRTGFINKCFLHVYPQRKKNHRFSKVKWFHPANLFDI